ncbi:prophage tail fiber N-terminal domain-containing protein [Klebsiella aerogenes]|uniref:prophage tail fiber N-terminal domain-containing protein n=1 Tax=Klebsiella aerogenes TaxID=548 RepID=UPI00351D6E2F
MTTIAGIFNDPFGVPIAGVQLLLTGRKNTSVTFTGTNATAVTASDGSYSMTVLPGVYAVSAKIGFTPDYLGIIQVYADSPDATLNQYLANFNPDDVTPEVLREMQLLLVEAEIAAKSAWLAAEKAKQYALIPRGEFNPDIVYQKNDLVEFDGSEYLATEDITGIAPPESPWQLFTSRGEQGVKGDTGEQGPQGEVGPKGDTGERGAQGEVGPKGDTGEQGPQGEVGPKGDTGPEGPEGPQGPAGEGAEGAVHYKGTWQSGTTYQLGDEVSETVNGVPGTFICLVESSSAEPSSSSDWRRVSGTASDIDGVSAGGDGKIEYNRTANITAETYKPNFNGELSWTLNISASVEIDLSSLVNTLFNTNPAAMLRLVITASEAASITFIGSDNYWLADGSYGTEPPEFSLDTSQSLMIIEVTNITNMAAPGVYIRQVYPALSDSILPGWYEPGASGLMKVPLSAGYPGNTIGGSSLRYAGVMDDGSQTRIQYTDGNIPSGTWELNGYVSSGGTGTHMATFCRRIDGTNLMPSSHLLQVTTTSDRIRNCQYSAPDNSLIDCEVLVSGKWYPFTASPTDSTAWGPVLYNAAVAGQFGEVVPYQA